MNSRLVSRILSSILESYTKSGGTITSKILGCMQNIDNSLKLKKKKYYLINYKENNCNLNIDKLNEKKA